MITDSFFFQGHTHEVCEDYAVHGENYAIISDGCSNGGGPRIHTDFGSRILAKAAEEHIETFGCRDHLFQSICATARTQQRTFPNLPESCLTATLMVLKEVGDDYRALTVGDGIVGGKRKDGNWTIHIIEYPKGGPYYLKYEMFGEVNKWLEQFGGNYKIKTYHGDLLSPKMVYPEWDLVPDFQPPTVDQRNLEWLKIMQLHEEKCEFDISHVENEFWFSKEDYDFVFVTSDGPESFYTPVKTQRQKYNQPIHVLDILRIMMDFAIIRPGFARLQANWAFRQDKKGTFKRLNWINGDDVSVGVIHG